ncbi:unnamed protein product, partial [Polarella glacialis]
AAVYLLVLRRKQSATSPGQKQLPPDQPRAQAAGSPELVAPATRVLLEELDLDEVLEAMLPGMISTAEISKLAEILDCLLCTAQELRKPEWRMARIEPLSDMGQRLL